MRDEDDVQVMADKVSSIINGGQLDGHDKTTLIAADGTPHDVERLRGLLDALDWVLDEDMEDDPV